MKVHNLNLSFVPAIRQEVEKKLKGEKYITYGDKNQYPDYLNDLFKSSPTHGALVKSKAMMVYGSGLVAEGEGAIEIDRLKLNRTLRESCLTDQIQEGFYWEIIWSEDRSKIATISEVPFQDIRMGEKEAGEVTHFLHAKDWKKDKPTRVEAFDPSKKNEHPRQILFVGSAGVGSDYYPCPDYESSINYIELERSLSTYFVHHVANGLHPGFLMVFKNGEPTEQDKATQRRLIESKLMGAENSNKFLIVYIEDGEEAPEFIALETPDVADQYTFLSEIAPEKIMVGHRVVSPMLHGLKNNTGLGNNAEELKEAAKLEDAKLIAPTRDRIENAIQPLLSELGISSFEWVSEGPYISEDAADVDQSFTGIQISSAIQVIGSVKTGELSRTQAISILVNMLSFDPIEAESLFETEIGLSKYNHLDSLIDKGEILDDDWEEVDSREVDLNIEQELDNRINLASIPTGDARKRSIEDSSIIKVRYRYAGEDKDDSREFCKKMRRSNRVFRREDIIKAGDVPVNPGFGPEGTDTYSIWEFKGGPNCHHFWERVTYLKKGNKRISVNEARRLINGLPPDERDDARLVDNPENVAKRPIDMPNNGYLAKLKKFLNGSK